MSRISIQESAFRSQESGVRSQNRANRSRYRAATGRERWFFFPPNQPPLASLRGSDLPPEGQAAEDAPSAAFQLDARCSGAVGFHHDFLCYALEPVALDGDFIAAGSQR